MNPNGICFIYGLVDPREPETIRYVGKTTDLEKRWLAHITKSKYLKCHRSSWIVSLIRQGIVPIMRIIMLCQLKDWQHVERKIISKFKSQKLTNGNEGGVGGGTPAPWVIEKIRNYRRLNAQSISQKLSEAFKKKWADPAYRERMSIAHKGKKQSPELIEKRIRPIRGRIQSESEKRNRSAALIKQRGVKVINLNTGNIFDSLADAAQSMGKPRIFGVKLSKALRKDGLFCGCLWSKYEGWPKYKQEKGLIIKP